MYILASILFLFSVFSLVAGLVSLAAAISLKRGTIYQWAYGLHGAYIAAYLAFIY